MATTFVVTMPPNPNDGRRKTTKLTADNVERKGDWVTFTNDVITGEHYEEEEVAEFYRPESWMTDEVTSPPAAPATER